MVHFQLGLKMMMNHYTLVSSPDVLIALRYGIRVYNTWDLDTAFTISMRFEKMRDKVILSQTLDFSFVKDSILNIYSFNKIGIISKYL